VVESAASGRGSGEGLSPLARDEELRVVEKHFAELSEESRALLALHYQHGLSQREIARTLGWRRGRVQTRLAAVLDGLRGSLGRGGALALVPAVEGILRRTELEAAPAPLREALLAVPQCAAAAAGGAGIGILGGALMAKSGPAALAAVAVLSVAIGLGAGRVIRGGGGASPEAEGEMERLRGRAATLEESLAAANEENQALAAQLAAAELAREEAVARADRVAAELAEGQAGTAVPAAAAAPGEEGEKIDWAAIATAFDENSALFLRLGEIFEQGLDPSLVLSRDEREAFRICRDLWMDAAEIARRGVDHPFLEPEILSPLLSALLGGPLDLTEEQLSGITAASDALLAEWSKAREGTPLEAWQARRAVWEGIGSELDSLLTPEQQEAWKGMRPAADRMLEPAARRFEFGLEGKEGIPERLVEEWRGHYGIAPEQEPRFLEMLADYDRGAREIMQRHLGEKGTFEALAPAARRALSDDYLEWQLRTEGRILGMLSEAQLSELRERAPAIWEFEPSGRTSISINDGASF
jgi:hypothetical protein